MALATGLAPSARRATAPPPPALPPRRVISAAELAALPAWAKPPAQARAREPEFRAATRAERRVWAARVRELMAESPLRDLGSAGLEARYELVARRLGAAGARWRRKGVA